MYFQRAVLLFLLVSILAACVSRGTAVQNTASSAIVLRAEEASLKTSSKLTIENNAVSANIGWWTSVTDEISWLLTVPAGGEYKVTASVSCASNTPGSSVRVTVGGAALTFIMPDTGGWMNYQNVFLGNITLRSGTQPVKVKAVSVAGTFVGNLRSLTFTRADAYGDRYIAMANAGIEQYRKTEAVIVFHDESGKALAGTPVQIRQLRHDFLFGGIIFDLVWSNVKHDEKKWKERFAGLFNYGILLFNWSGYEPTSGALARNYFRPLVNWCLKEGITVMGHTLVWTNHYGVPGWVKAYPPEKSEKLLLARVKREINDFKGSINYWIVVNESIHCRTWENTAKPDYSWESISDVADYVDKALHAARSANPQAHLILNDFGQIARKNERDRFCDLVAELKRRGSPLDGLGLQAHEPKDEWFAPEKVRATLDRLAAFGYALHITEFTPQSSGKPITGGYRSGVWTKEAQAEFAEQFYRICFGHPAVVSISWWGMSDRDSWLPSGGLLNKDYTPKPAYDRLHYLIHSEWKTNLDAKTDSKGAVSFSGFYGVYDVTIELPDGKLHSFTVELKKGVDNRFVFTVK
jgi:endo-1,4-beta-xylanase